MSELKLDKIENVKEFYAIYDNQGEIVAGSYVDTDNNIQCVVVRATSRNLNYGTKLVKRIIHETVERPLVLKCDIYLLGFFIKCGFLITKVHISPDGKMNYILKHY